VYAAEADVLEAGLALCRDDESSESSTFIDVSRTSIWRINVGEPSVLDYSTECKSAGQVTSLYAADEYRSSDHDPVIVDLELGGKRICLPVVMRGYLLP
jgi:predicted extracellular nuclease